MNVGKVPLGIDRPAYEVLKNIHIKSSVTSNQLKDWIKLHDSNE